MTQPRESHKLPSLEYLKTRLRYEPESGDLFWLSCNTMPNNWNARFSNKKALSCVNSNGYRRGKINKIDYFAHRVAWALYYGEWPSDFIDHINHNKLDNRICNLRVVSHRDNQKNKRMLSRNTSGVTGVSWAKREKRWETSIMFDNKKVCLGYFCTLEEAAKVREKAEIKYGYHKNHGRSN